MQHNASYYGALGVVRVSSCWSKVILCFKCDHMTCETVPGTDEVARFPILQDFLFPMF
jgi:hypothetical protein